MRYVSPYQFDNPYDYYDALDELRNSDESGCDDRSHHDYELDHGDYTPMTDYDHCVNANF